ncbi:MAG: beta-propeller domain-containing protein [Candidatus Micrarchaeota archaeon]|nr:beta-propeller domain-containing protein [Candidatus Micrarchaeota archaeon]
MESFKAVAAIALTIILLFAGCAGSPQAGEEKPAEKPQTPPTQPKAPASSQAINSFSSWDEVSDFLRSANPQAGYGIYASLLMRSGMALDAGMGAKVQGGVPSLSAEVASEYSKTNVQVEGIDEADVVKNDGKYIYVAGNEYDYSRVGPFSFDSSKGKVYIVDSYPPSSMKLVSQISFDGRASEIFVYKDKLVVFGNRYDHIARPYPLTDVLCARCIIPPFYSQIFSFMKIYDITDRSNPKLEKEYEVKGNYITSRMIEGKVYGIFSDQAYYYDPVPLYAVDGQARKIAPQDIFYLDWPDSSYNYNIFLSADLNDLSKPEKRKIILMGDAQNLFVSQENIYVTYTKYDYYHPEWKAFYEVYGDYLPAEAKERIAAIDASNYSEWRKDKMKMAEISDYVDKIAKAIPKDQLEKLQKAYSDKLSELQLQRSRTAEKTSITRLSLSDFEPTGKAEVPGHVLNQFSMDEHNGYFRIATTVSQVWGWAGQGNLPSYSNLYILDRFLNQAGKVENIAPGEQIYSVRFMGDKAYMVTFKQIDPFFVLDLSNPANPTIAGKLKLPGYSNYLHPYDENHIIGIGNEAEEDKEGQFAWQKGVKISLFDVSDMANPREVAKYEIGDRGTYSPALHDHKALLFSREKNLLVLPVSEARIDSSKYAGGVVPPWQYGDFVFQGAYVFNISQNSIELRGRISHATDQELKKMRSHFWEFAVPVSRSLYMDNYLYTISDRYVKANDLLSLAPISSVQVANWPPGD